MALAAFLSTTVACASPSDGGQKSRKEKSSDGGAGGANEGASQGGDGGQSAVAGGQGGGRGGAGGEGGAAAGGAGGGNGGGAGGQSAGNGGAGGTGETTKVMASPAEAYFAKECAKCHGDAGQGTTLGPEIQHPVRDFATWVIRNGRQRPDYKMPMEKRSEGVLSTTLLNEVFDFLDKPAKPTTGKALYADYCANCHGVKGAGGLANRPLAKKSDSDFVTHVRQGHHPGEFGKRTGYMPKWSASALSDAELKLIRAFVVGP